MREETALLDFSEGYESRWKWTRRIENVNCCMNRGLKKEIFRCIPKNRFVPWIFASAPDFEHRIEGTNMLSSNVSLLYTGEENACIDLYSSDQ